MMRRMAKQVIILHGYSDESASFKPLANFLKAQGFKAVPIYLGDYVSLEDNVTIPDLAKAFVNALADKGISTKEASFDLIVHSTGALVAREWMTRFFLEHDLPCPVDHFLMLAPANFGSPLGHLGKTMFGRIVKGWKTGFQSGTQVLSALELASPYTFDLARRDLFGGKSFYQPQMCKTAVLVGSKPYQTGFRKLVDKNGGDGTVYVSTANLNCAGMRLSFRKGQDAPTSEPWNSAAEPIAFGVFPDRDHASITDPGKGDAELGAMIVSFLKTNSVPAYTQFFTQCQERTDKTLPEKPAQDIYHTYQHLVTRVTDDLGFAVTDYFLEFYEKPATARDRFKVDDLMIRVHTEILEAVHPYSLDESYRSFIFDLTDLRTALLGGEQLMFSLSAAPLGRYVGFSTGAPNDFSEIPIGKKSDGTPDSWFWRPNQTLLLDIGIERTQDPKLFKLTKY